MLRNGYCALYLFIYMLQFVRSRISYGFVCVTSELCTAECQMQNIYDCPAIHLKMNYSKVYPKHTYAIIYIYTYLEGVLGSRINLIFKRVHKIV